MQGMRWLGGLDRLFACLLSVINVLSKLPTLSSYISFCPVCFHLVDGEGVDRHARAPHPSVDVRVIELLLEPRHESFLFQHQHQIIEATWESGRGRSRSATNAYVCAWLYLQGSELVEAR